MSNLSNKGYQGIRLLIPFLRPATEQFTDNDAATELRARNQREPHVVPDLERNTVAKTS